MKTYQYLLQEIQELKEKFINVPHYYGMLRRIEAENRELLQRVAVLEEWTKAKVCIQERAKSDGKTRHGFIGNVEWDWIEEGKLYIARSYVGYSSVKLELDYLEVDHFVDWYAKESGWVIDKSNQK